MRQYSDLLQRLQATKKIRAYIAQNMIRQQKLHEELEMAKAVEATTWKVAEEGANLLRKAELENESLKVKIR